MDLYSSVIHKSRYARYLDEHKRRESWEETVDRLIDYLHFKIDNSNMTEEDKQKFKEVLG